MSLVQRTVAPLAQDEKGIWRALESVSVSYPETGHSACYSVEDRSFWFQHRNACIKTVVEKFPPPDQGEILDIGGGNGVVSDALYRAGYRVALLEPGIMGARNAINRGIPTVINGTLETVQFQPAALSAAGAFDVIEHIQDDLGFLSEIRQALRPGGRLYATVPAYSSLWSAEDIEAGHFRRFRRSQIIDLFKRANFDVEYCSYIFWYLPVPMLFLRALPYRLGFSSPRRAESEVQADHASENTWVGRLLTRLLAPERACLKRGYRLPIGGSCLIVGKRR